MIAGNIIGAILKNPDTIILRTESGNEHTAVVTNEEVQITATANDVRLGETVALEKGVVTGEKFIPAYHTFEGFQAIPDGSEYVLSHIKEYDGYDFNRLQVVFCDFNTTISDSVSAHMVCLNGPLYAVQSTTPLANATKNDADKVINLGLMNNTGKLQILRYFTYKET